MAEEHAAAARTRRTVEETTTVAEDFIVGAARWMDWISLVAVFTLCTTYIWCSLLMNVQCFFLTFEREAGNERASGD